jgi:hypothetical protein
VLNGNLYETYTYWSPFEFHYKQFFFCSTVTHCTGNPSWSKNCFVTWATAMPLSRTLKQWRFNSGALNQPDRYSGNTQDFSTGPIKLYKCCHTMCFVIRYHKMGWRVSTQQCHIQTPKYSKYKRKQLITIYGSASILIGFIFISYTTS